MESDIKNFLKNLSDNYDTLSEVEKRKISELYLSFLYTDNVHNATEAEILKYLSLGWFLYNKNS